MPLKLSESAYYTGEEERQRKIVAYREKVWQLFREQMAITDDMRHDPPYRQNRILLMRLMGALVVKLNDDEAAQWLKDSVKGYYAGSQVEYVTKGLETLFSEACRDFVSREKKRVEYANSLKSIHPGAKL